MAYKIDGCSLAAFVPIFPRTVQGTLPIEETAIQFVRIQGFRVAADPTGAVPTRPASGQTWPRGVKL